MTPRRRVKLYSLGCRLNEAELEDWGARFEQAGLSVVADHQPADLVVVNTCAVTREAARKSRQLLRKAQRTQPEARLIVSGCLATLEHETLAQSLGADLIIDNADKDRLVELSLSALAIPTMPALASTEMAPGPSGYTGLSAPWIAVIRASRSSWDRSRSGGIWSATTLRR